MPSNATNVGALRLPVPASDISAGFDDPLVIALLDYLSHWLNWGLNARLAVQLGTSDEAVPTANRFPFDPGRVFVRRAVPALYCWCPGESVELVQWTMMQRMSRRTVHAVWIFDQLVTPSGATMRNGLLRAADALLMQAEANDRHATWPTNPVYSDIPANSSFGRVFQLRSWLKGPSEYGVTWQLPSASSMPGGPGDGAPQYGYPTLRTSFVVEEMVGLETLTGADLLTTHSTVVVAGDHLDDLQNAGNGYGVEVDYVSPFPLIDPDAIGELPIGA